MQRRSFLKLASMAAVGLFAHLAFPWTAAAAKPRIVSYAGSLYRAGGKGKIMASANGGATWRLHSDLGDLYTITGLAVDRANRLRLSVDFGGRPFRLRLAPDQQRWLTT
jgi:hypothetical protein